MTTTLFDLTGDALRLQGRINSAAEQLFSDDPAEVAAATAQLEALIDAEADNRREVETKADTWCWVIDGLRARSAAQKEHAKRLATLAKEAEQQADVLQDRLVAALQRIDPDATSHKLPEHKITSRKSTAVEMDPDLDPQDLPAWCQRKKIEADKAAIRERLDAGHLLPFASLVERRSWTIK